MHVKLFSRRQHNLIRSPVFMGFFRSMTANEWKVSHTECVLSYAASRPELFGFPKQPTCIVNPAYLLPHFRSKRVGVHVFGHERGCKSIVIPPSCDNRQYDELDAQLFEPLFRWNPGANYVYLSYNCQNIAAQLAPYMARCECVLTITLEGWTNAASIHRLLMACKHVEELDALSYRSEKRNWKNELSVQALTTLIEMHPKLRTVKASRLFLQDWEVATLKSRCKHHVALISSGTDIDFVFITLHLLLLVMITYATYHLFNKLLSAWYDEEELEKFEYIYAFLLLCIFALAEFRFNNVVSTGWVHLVKDGMVLRHRLRAIKHIKEAVHTNIAKQ